MRALARRWLGIDEIENSPGLRAVFWALLVGFILELVPQSEWFKGGQRHFRENGEFACWPHLPDCDKLFFFDSVPWGYSAPILVAVLAMILGAAAWSASRGRWLAATSLLIPLLLWKLFYHFVLHQTHMVNFQLFHLPFVFLFIFARSKWFYLRLSVAVLYSLAATVKFTPSWIEGAYFQNLSLGLPLVPRPLIPWVTNAVIVFEIFGSWGLIAPWRRVRRAAFAGWVAFHFYSVILVGLFYPLHCLPVLAALFGRDDGEPGRAPRLSLSFGILAPVVLFAGLALLQLVPRWTLPDWRYSGSVYQYGFDMIGANYQCRVQWRAFDREGAVLQEKTWTSREAVRRCPPYNSWFPLKTKCARDPRIARIELRHDISVDGGPFYRIVDTENACALSYNPMTRNDWIRTPEEGAAIVGGANQNPMMNSRSRRAQADLVDETRLEAPPARPPWSRFLEIFYMGLWVVVSTLGVWLTWRPLSERDPTSRVRANP